MQSLELVPLGSQPRACASSPAHQDAEPFARVLRFTRLTQPTPADGAIELQHEP